MISDFFLLQSRLNLLSLSSEKHKELVNSKIPKKAVTYFEYGKSEEKYWTEKHLLDQIVKKALPIGEALYLVYTLLFLFDNTTSHSIYALDVLQIVQMNKKPEG